MSFVMAKRGVLFFCFFLFCAQLVFAEFPVPGGASLIKQESVVTEGGERKVNFYETRMNAKDIIAFYRKEMTRRGYSVLVEGELNIAFLKGSETTILAVVPSAVARDKNQFIVTSASMEGVLNPQQPAVCEDIPGVPAYPGAKCERSMRMKGSKTHSVSYFTADSVSAVLNFYRLKMPAAGWTLEQEIDTGQALSGNMPDNLKDYGIDFSNSRQYVFKNYQGAQCTVMVMEAIIGRNTTINIIYSEKPQQ